MKVQCLICNKYFINQEWLDKHWNDTSFQCTKGEKVDRTEWLHKCTHCKKVFKEAKDLERHFKSQHLPKGLKKDKAKKLDNYISKRRN